MSVSRRPFAKRSLGQNFLQDENIARKIVASLDLKSGDAVLEIGPGRGALTRWLAEWANSSPDNRVQALEKDEDLAREIADEYPRIEVVVADALRFPWESLSRTKPLKYVGNLPYNIASPLIWELVNRSPAYERAVFMVQHEVGMRLCARPGGNDYGALSAWVQSFARVRYLFRVPPHVFRPQPKVDSAVMLFEPMVSDNRPSDPDALASLLHICFQKRRKQLRNILRTWWSQAVEQSLEGRVQLATTRPEELTPREFQVLARVLFESFDPRDMASGPQKEKKG